MEGTHYVRLAQPVPMPAAGKVEVVEFFCYGCPHCNAFEPALDAWARKLPADVGVPPRAGGVPRRRQEPSKIYLRTRGLGQLEALHRKVFAAIHVQRQRLEKDAEIAAFVTARTALDATKFMDTYNRFSVAASSSRRGSWPTPTRSTACRRSASTAASSRRPSLAGSGEQALRVTDYLIQRAKQS